MNLRSRVSTVAFSDFLVEFFKYQKFTLKQTKHLDDTGSHDMKFILCFNNITQIIKNDEPRL